MEKFDVSAIQEYDQVFSKEDYYKIIDQTSSANWHFGHGSFQNGDPRRGTPFWRQDLKDNEFFSRYLLNIIEEKTEQHYELFDVYANGHTYGTQGSFHQDWYDNTGRTFLFYSNEQWRLNWGGKTAFDFGNGDTYFHVPKPNSAILFPGMIPHCAEHISRSFVGLRVTIAWKLILKES